MRITPMAVFIGLTGLDAEEHKDFIVGISILITRLDMSYSSKY